VKGYEELINGKNCPAKYKTVLSLVQKINLLFYEITGFFLSTVLSKHI